jgi:hypothetical protein
MKRVVDFAKRVVDFERLQASLELEHTSKNEGGAMKDTRSTALGEIPSRVRLGSFDAESSDSVLGPGPSAVAENTSED